MDERAAEPRWTRPGPALVEFVIEQEANVFPMIPPGASLSEPIEGEEAPLARLRGWSRHDARPSAVTVLLEDRLITFNRAVGLVRRRNLSRAQHRRGPHGDAGRFEAHDHGQFDGATADRAVQHLEKVVGVRAAATFPARDGVAREMALVKVARPAERYGELLDVVQLYHATVVDDSRRRASSSS